jgi:hypothetical protein
MGDSLPHSFALWRMSLSIRDDAGDFALAGRARAASAAGEMRAGRGSCRTGRARRGRANCCPRPDHRSHDRPVIAHGPRRARSPDRGHVRPQWPGARGPPMARAGWAALVVPAASATARDPGGTDGSERSWKLRAERRLWGPGVHQSLRQARILRANRAPGAGCRAGGTDGGGGTGVHAAPGKALEGSWGTYPNSPGTAGPGTPVRGRGTAAAGACGAPASQEGAGGTRAPSGTSGRCPGLRASRIRVSRPGGSS